MKKNNNSLEEQVVIAYDRSKDFISNELTMELIKIGYPIKSTSINDNIKDFNVSEDFVVVDEIKKLKYYIPTICQVSRWFYSKGFKVETGPYWINKKLYWQFILIKNAGTLKETRSHSVENEMYKTNQEAVLAAFDYILNCCLNI